MKDGIKAMLICAAIAATILIANAVFLYVMVSIDTYLSVVFPWSVP